MIAMKHWSPLGFNYIEMETSSVHHRILNGFKLTSNRQIQLLDS